MALRSKIKTAFFVRRGPRESAPRGPTATPSAARAGGQLIASRSPRKRVFVTRSLPGAALERLRTRSDLDVRVWSGDGQPPRSVLEREIARCAGLLCLLTDQIDAGLIRSASALRVISSCSVGLDHVDLAAATHHGVQVGYTPGVLVETTADLSFALLLAAARRIVEADRFVRDGAWTWERRWEPELLIGRDLHGATLGLVGLGAIGRAVARRAAGFGMRVLGWNRTPRAVPGVEAVPLARLWAESDFVSVHVALTPETRGLVGAAEIAAMRSGSILVNTARGGIVDETALYEALRSGQLAAAGLDVFEREPLSPESPLLRLPNIVLLPHIGSASLATRARMADLAVDNLLAGVAGQPMPHCANPQAGGAGPGGAQAPSQ